MLIKSIPYLNRAGLAQWDSVVVIAVEPREYLRVLWVRQSLCTSDSEV